MFLDSRYDSGSNETTRRSLPIGNTSSGVCDCRVQSTQQELRIMILSPRNHRSFIALAFLAALGSAAVAGSVEHIGKARREALGTTVTVRGTVTVPTDAFDPGFAIQDGHAGIYVLDSGGVARELGDVVEV